MLNLSIIILSYNTKKLTVECIDSVYNQYEKELKTGEMEIIVVDNASSDGSYVEISSLKEQISNLKIILSKKNLGFAGGCNLGAKNANGKYLLFLNSDTEVLDKGFIKMINFLVKNPKVGILGGKIKNIDGSIQPSAGKFYNLFNLALMLLGFERLGMIRSSPEKIEKVDWVSGACMMVDKEMFKKISGFDEKFFMYVEDMEMCFRANKNGLETYFYPDLNLKHKALGSSDKSFAIINIYKGISYFYKKHKTNLEHGIAKTLLSIKAVLMIMIGILTINLKLVNRYIKAIKQI